MINADQVIQDLVQLGWSAWFTKYKGQLPTQFTPSVLADRVIALGLQFQLIDSENALSDDSAPCFLVHQKGENGRYVIFVRDGMKGVLIGSASYTTLREAIAAKLEYALVELR